MKEFQKDTNFKTPRAYAMIESSIPNAKLILLFLTLTSTKMNFYLSNYLISKFTDTVDDFKHINEFTLCLKYLSSKKTRKIVTFEQSDKNYSMCQ